PEATNSTATSARTAMVTTRQPIAIVPLEDILHAQFCEAIARVQDQRDYRGTHPVKAAVRIESPLKRTYRAASAHTMMKLGRMNAHPPAQAPQNPPRR